MSADNGMVIRKFSDTCFKVYEYDASSGSETLRGSYFTTLKEALEYASSCQTEYGVTYEDKSAGEHRIETTIDEFSFSIAKGKPINGYSFADMPSYAKVTIEWRKNKK